MNELAIKWYKYLGFPPEYDEEFYALAESKDISEIPAENTLEYLENKKDYGLNLIYFLTRLDITKATMDKRGIDKKYFDSTAAGLLWEVMNTKKAFGTFGVSEALWWCLVTQGDFLFRIGRLNYGMEVAPSEWCGDESVVKTGDTILVTHIPAGSKLDIKEAFLSIVEAEVFFKTYFPEKNIRGFICGSWLLDRTLDLFLKEGSNIVKYRNLFERYMDVEAYSAIKFGFGSNVTRENLEDFEPKNSFQEKLKAHILGGGKLYETFGFRSFFGGNAESYDELLKNFCDGFYHHTGEAPEEIHKVRLCEYADKLKKEN